MQISIETINDKHPDIAAALRAEGAQHESARIQAVQAQALPGHETLIAEMVADGKTTGPEAAMRILQAEKKTREDQLGGIKSDAALLDGKAPPAPPPAAPADLSQLPVEERCKAQWESDPQLRESFASLENFTAYTKAVDKGMVRERRTRG